MDLIRKIMLNVESEDGDKGQSNLIIDGYPQDIIAEHVRLIHDAGFIEGPVQFESGSTKVIAYSINRITWNGYEFIDACRDHNRWMEVKRIVAEKGSTVSMEILLMLLKSFTLKQFGL